MFLFHYFDVDLVVDAGRDTRRLFLFLTTNLIPICISRKISQLIWRNGNAISQVQPDISH